MRYRHRFTNSRRRGLVLIAVLALAALAAAIAFETAYLTRVEGARVSLDREWTKADLMARTGVIQAKIILENDDREVDSLDELWSQPLSIPGENGATEVRIHDLSARFPLDRLFTDRKTLNLEVKRSLEKYFGELDLPSDLVDKLIDYIDPDDQPFPQGAEGDAYRRLKPSRRPANRPLLVIEELRNVAGLVDDLETADRLIERMTLYGTGQINVNTASEELLAGWFVELTSPQARRISNRATVVPFQSIEDIQAAVDISPQAASELKSRGSVSSSAFFVESTGTYGKVSVKRTAVVERRKDDIIVTYIAVD